MKKTKVLLILFLIVFVSIIPFSYVNAHSVNLDPEKLITLPWFLSDGEGTISIDNSQTGYSLYYQAVEISDANYNQMVKIRDNGEATLDILDSELDKLKAERNNLNTVYKEAFDAWQAKVKSNASTEEVAAAKTEYETAQENYDNKVTEYNSKVEEYNNKSKEIDNNINALIPSYVESNWIKTEDGKIAVDLSKFSGQKAFAVWVKLVSSDGTIHYDENIYVMSGTKEEEIAVETISLDQTVLNLIEGSNYTLIATITPSDATNTSIVWTSDNENVAKVEAGKVIAISEGIATITATTQDGGYIATCKVNVTKKDTTPVPDNNKPDPTPTPDNSKPDATQKSDNSKAQDSTAVNGKLPQTGSLTYVIILAIPILSVIGIISYKKVKYLNFK